MKFRTLVTISAAVVMTVTQTAYAQTATYSLTTQIKCKPGKTAECEEYLAKTLHKSMQLRVERGIIDSFTLTQLVDPQASPAGFTHTYVVISSKPFAAEQSAEYRKAGADATGMSAEENLARQNEVREIVSRYRGATSFSAGELAQKGDFIRSYFLRTPHGKRTELADSMKLRRGMMEQLAKSGHVRRWIFREVMLRGETDPFDATESMTYKDAEAVMAVAPPRDQLKAAFVKGNPGKDYDQYVAQRRELNHVRMVRTSKVIDVIRK